MFIRPNIRRLLRVRELHLIAVFPVRTMSKREAVCYPLIGFLHDLIGDMRLHVQRLVALGRRFFECSSHSELALEAINKRNGLFQVVQSTRLVFVYLALFCAVLAFNSAVLKKTHNYFFV